MSDRTILERGVGGATPPPDGFERMLRRRDRKRRTQRISAGVVGIAVFVTAVWIVTTGGSFNRTQQPAIQPTPTPEPSMTAPEVAYLIDLNTGEMTPLLESIGGGYGSPRGGYTVSPDGTMVAYTSGDDAGNPQVFIASLDGTDVQQVTHDQRGAVASDWSPDGAAIVYTSGESTSLEGAHNIFVLDLATGETSQVTHYKPPADAESPQFSSDGASIVYHLHRDYYGSVRIVSVTSGKSVLLVGGNAGLGTLSPDGSTLAVGGCPEGICIADADGTNLRVLVSGPGLTFPKWSPDGTRIAYTSQAVTSDIKVFVVDVATGETTFVAEGFAADWLDDHTLMIVNFG